MRITNRLILEKPIKEDFERFYEINSDPDTNIYNPHGAMNYNIALTVFKKTLEHWEENKFGNWKISERETPNYIIGFGGLSNRKYGDKLKLNLGFRFDKLYWGKGYATEFAKDTIDYGFNELNRKYIYGLVRPENLASIKVLEKCNMLVFDTLSDVPNEEDSLVYRINKNHITVANKA